MKKQKQIQKQARKIVEQIFRLRDAVIKAEDATISDTYRGFIMGLEEQSAKPFEDFANNLPVS